MIHPLSDVQSKDIGENTNIWQFCVVLPNAKIGKNCNICSHCFIENDVVIGDNVTIGAGSVVTRDIPSNTVAVGNPCKVVKSL